jgi:hypothetical protein
MKQNNSKLAKRLSQYGSFALAVVGVSEADGQIIYTDVNPDFSGAMGSSYAIDLDNNGVDDVIIDNNTYSSFSIVFPRIYANPQGTNAVLGSIGSGVYAYPYALNSGDNISSGALGTFLGNYYNNSMNYNNSFGNWVGATDKYLGVQFDISGSTHYGWVRLDVSMNGDFVVKDFAYESTSGLGIMAGEMPPPCTDPTALIANNVDNDSAEISWTAGGSETEWEIEYGTTGFTPGAGTIVADNDSSLGETLSGLTASTTYDVYVTAICGPGDESNQVGPQSFTTLADPCADVTNIAVLGITNNSADITWTAGGSETEWEIEYGTTGFTPGAGTVVADNDSSLGETLSGLTASTTYDVYVTAICGPGDESNQVGPESFTTEPLGVEEQVFEGFSYYPNPVREQLVLNAKSNIDEIVVYDLLGNRVFSENPNQMDYKVDLSKLQRGSYLMKVGIEGGEKMFKLIKE